MEKSKDKEVQEAIQTLKNKGVSLEILEQYYEVISNYIMKRKGD